MTEDHFIKIYTSAVLKKMNISDQAKRCFLDMVIDALGTIEAYGIRRVHTGREGDLIIGVEDSATVDHYVNLGHIYF
jgi:hypothetical protein